MAASFNAGFHGDTSDLNCSLCVDKYPIPTNNGHHQLVGLNSHPLSMQRFNNNNGYYGNGTSSSSSGLMVGGGNDSPDHSDGGGGGGSSLLLADLLQTLSNATSNSRSPSPPPIPDIRYII